MKRTRPHSRLLGWRRLVCGSSLLFVAGVPSEPVAATATQQQTSSAIAQATQDGPVTDQAEPNEPDEIYSYNAAGRRDPFVSLLGRAASSAPVNARPPGLAGLSVNELSLHGLVLTGGRYLAVMQAPDRKTYILSGEEQLFDALVKSVSAEGITFLQTVNDPLSLVKEREVLRTLQGREDGR